MLIDPLGILRLGAWVDDGNIWPEEVERVERRRSSPGQLLAPLTAVCSTGPQYKLDRCLLSQGLNAYKVLNLE